MRPPPQYPDAVWRMLQWGGGWGGTKMIKGSGPCVYCVTLSGIPGCGKSSLLKGFRKTGFLQEELDKIPQSPLVLIVLEPSKLWRTMGWLQEFYSNPSQNAAAFQFLVFDSHVDAVEAAIEEGKTRVGTYSSILLITERGMLDQLLFWRQQVDANHASATPLYDAAYTRIWSKWNRFVPTPSLMIFMYTSDLQSTMKRVKARRERRNWNNPRIRNQLTWIHRTDPRGQRSLSYRIPSGLAKEAS